MTVVIDSAVSVRKSRQLFKRLSSCAASPWQGRPHWRELMTLAVPVEAGFLFQLYRPGPQPLRQNLPRFYRLNPNPALRWEAPPPLRSPFAQPLSRVLCAHRLPSSTSLFSVSFTWRNMIMASISSSSLECCCCLSAHRSARRSWSSLMLR